MRDDRGVVEHDALVDFPLLERREQAADGAAGARASLARMAVFMSSVMRSLRVMAVLAGAKMTKARDGVPRVAGFGRPARGRAQYSFFGSCMLRTRLKWRFTAAAFLRLRSAVGFS